MSWAKWAKRGSPFAVAFAAVSYYVYDKAGQEKNILHASWTTNFEPSVKWDYNWDKYVLLLFYFHFVKSLFTLIDLSSLCLP